MSGDETPAPQNTEHKDEEQQPKKEEDQPEAAAPIAVRAITLPTFLPKNPRLWFVQVESQFDINRITSERVKYGHLICNIPGDALAAVEDIVLQPFKKGNYELLKKAFLDRLMPSSAERIKEVLDDMQFSPPEKPSAFFRRMWAAADGLLAYDVVITRFRERMPQAISNTITPMITVILEAHKADSTTRPIKLEGAMLEVADLIASSVSVAAVTANNNNNNSKNKNNSGQKQNRFQNQNNKNHSQNRGRSKSPARFRENGSWCKNHYKYREKTRVCARPGNCSYRSNSSQDASKNE